MIRNSILFLIAIAAIVSNMKVIDYFYKRPINCPNFVKMHGSLEQWKKVNHIKVNYKDEAKIYQICDVLGLEIVENYRVAKYLILKLPENMPLEKFMELSQEDCVECLNPW
jgi:hypothetical protein